MYLLYVDESGVTNPHPSQTSHYVTIGLAVHVGTWVCAHSPCALTEARLPSIVNSEADRTHCTRYP